MFPSGEWRGFWEATGWGRRWMEPLTLRFTDGHIVGDGADCVGQFTFAGTYTDDGEVHMVKLYQGAHAVRYDGRVDGEGAVVGQWTVTPNWYGPFALMPAMNVSDMPIAVMAAEAEE